MNGELRAFTGLFSLQRCFLAAGWVFVSSCASPLATSAKQDDLTSFQAKLRGAEKPLSDAELLEVSRAVAERELVSMSNDNAVARVTELESCVAELEPIFQRLSERDDVVGAVTTQVLLDEGLWQGDRGDLVQQHRTNALPEWRAVAARASVGKKHADVRRAAFLDGDLRVRRAALRAARDTRTGDDLDALLEAARVDPDPVARRFALEAISAIAEPRTLSRLRDAWPYADEATRLELVFAWGRKRAFANGGRAQLGWVLATQAGLPRLAAAVVLLQRSAEQNTAKVASGHDAVAAEGALVLGFTDGTTDEQEFVARHAPRTTAVVQAFVDGLSSEDEQKTLSAASVLVRATRWRKLANERLTTLLASKTPEVAEQARVVLARERAPHVKSQLQKRLTDSNPATRIAAAQELLRYHRAGERGLGFEQLLADPDASVRSTIACALIEQLGD